VPAERFTAVVTGLLSLAKPGDAHLRMDGYPLVSGLYTLDQGRPHHGELGQETSFPELPQDCKNPVLDTYGKMCGL
jgi:hypothetical protein